MANQVRRMQFQLDFGKLYSFHLPSDTLLNAICSQIQKIPLNKRLLFEFWEKLVPIECRAS